MHARPGPTVIPGGFHSFPAGSWETGTWVWRARHLRQAVKLKQGRKPSECLCGRSDPVGTVSGTAPRRGARTQKVDGGRASPAHLLSLPGRAQAGSGAGRAPWASEPRRGTGTLLGQGCGPWAAVVGVGGREPCRGSAPPDPLAGGARGRGRASRRGQAANCPFRSQLPKRCWCLTGV